MFKDLVMNSGNTKTFARTVVVFAILLAISTLLIRYLWNESLVKHVSILKPVKNLTEALLLSIALSVIKGCC